MKKVRKLGIDEVELIVDGIHICPEMIKLSYQQISSKRGVLITDAIREGGLEKMQI